MRKKREITPDAAPAPAACAKVEKPKRGELLAQCTVAPAMRHASASQAFAMPIMGDEASWADATAALSARLKEAATGDRRIASDMLTAQAITLDSVFTEMLRRAGNNMGEYPEAAEQYMRLALRAQANSRATLEALMRLHQPREQTVKHVHVNAGGQAVVADEFHHHQSGGQNVRHADQPYEPVAALPCPDPLGDAVPVPGCAGAEKVPAARRRGRKRRAEG